VSDGAAGFIFDSFGVTVEVTCDDPAMLERLPAALPPGWRACPGASPSVRFALTGDGGITRDGAIVDSAYSGPAETLARELRHHIALHAPEHVFIHAGVVAIDGRAIVIPGRTFSGKTTLVARLLDAGAVYYSDEYAAVDPTGAIHPFAKALSVRPAGRYDGEPVPVRRARTGSAPIRAGLVLVTSYQPAARWRPRTVSPAAGALALLENTVPARSRPQASLVAVGQLAADATILVGSRGEAAEVASAVAGLGHDRSWPEHVI
jgi:hypothetical protein